jgi:hypothetical protein
MQQIQILGIKVIKSAIFTCLDLRPCLYLELVFALLCCGIGNFHCRRSQRGALFLEPGNRPFCIQGCIARQVAEIIMPVAARFATMICLPNPQKQIQTGITGRTQ